MSVIQPSPLVPAFEQSDVTLSDPLSLISSRVWLTNGDTLVLPVDWATLLTAINDPTPLLMSPIATPTMGGGFAAVAAARVSQVRALNVDTCLVTMDSGKGGPLVLEMAAADFIDAVNDFIGGEGTPHYLDAQPFVLGIVNQAGNAFAQNGPTGYSRMGLPGSTEPQVGDLVRCTTRIYGTVDAGGFLSVEITSPFPIPNAGFQCTTNVRRISGDAAVPADGLLINRNTSDTFYVQGGPFTLETVLMIDLDWSHQADGV